jgi:2-keto-3-deoxy-L-rhamnonate aldolase RhmA
LRSVVLWERKTLLLLNDHIIKGAGMKFIRDKILNGDLMCSIAAQLGSSLTVEMISNEGFDWTWIDCEHGSGDYSELIYQLQVARMGNAPPASWCLM